VTAVIAEFEVGDVVRVRGEASASTVVVPTGRPHEVRGDAQDLAGSHRVPLVLVRTPTKGLGNVVHWVRASDLTRTKSV